MHKIEFFKRGHKICAEDFKNRLDIEYINLQQISSISGISKFYGHFSGEVLGEFSTITMQNGNMFYVDKEEHLKLMKVLSKFDLK